MLYLDELRRPERRPTKDHPSRLSGLKVTPHANLMAQTPLRRQSFFNPSLFPGLYDFAGALCPTTGAPTTALTSIHTGFDAPPPGQMHAHPRPSGPPPGKRGLLNSGREASNRGEGVSQPPTGDTETPAKGSPPWEPGYPNRVST